MIGPKAMSSPISPPGWIGLTTLLLLLLTISAGFTTPSRAAEPPRSQATGSRPSLSPAEYGRWEALWGSPKLSPDGRWLAYRTRKVDRTYTLHIRQLDGDAEWAFVEGSAPQFSASGGWISWTVGVSEAEKKRLVRKKEPVRMGVGLLRLADGQEERIFDDVREASFDESGRFLALLGYAPDEPEGKGADLRLFDVETGAETTFGNVAEFAWSKADPLLAFVVMRGDDSGNGVQVYDAASGRLQSLDSSGSAYRGLVWREDATDLVVFRTVEPASEDGTAYAVLAWRGLDADEPERVVLRPDHTPIGKGIEVSRHGDLRWSDDGSMIALGLRSRDRNAASKDKEDPDADEEGADEDSDEPELPNLQIWHSSDVRIVPRQMAEKDADAKRTLLAIWHLDDDRLVRIGSDLMEETELLEGWRHAVEQVSAPYPWGKMFGRPYHDVFVVDVETGERTQLLSKVRHDWASAGGRYLLSFDGTDYWADDLRTGMRANLTEGIEADFADTEYDTPTDLLPPHGVGGWLGDDEAVLLYDRFDVWRIAPDGSGGTRLTRGAEDEVVYRLEDLDPDEERFDPDSPLYFWTRGEWTERRGYARLLPGEAEPEQLLERDAMLLRLTKAERADVFVFSAEARDDSPDYFIAGPDLAGARQVTETNPFLADYPWTRSELFEFESLAGRRLQAGLLYPANYDGSRCYPMIVYTYEILTPSIHSFEVPDERDYYNFTAWTQAGYFVLMPDIVYRARDPGISALEAVRPAVEAVVERGLVDPERVGLIGHSWGGYQATFLPTRTDIFAASVAGAPLTDFVSFMGQIHWNPGIPEVDHWETGQARMEVPYWEDPEAHHRNSPIHKVHELNTPILMAFGDDDGVVDWDQGTEFYNYARRAGKPMVFLVYEGEDHGFRREPNQVDYHRRILEWFGHYLKGETAPEWIREGIAIDAVEDEARRLASKGEAANGPSEADATGDADPTSPPKKGE